MSTEENQNQGEDEFGTTDESYRSKYLSTFISVVVVLTFLGLAVAEAAGYTSGSVSVRDWAVLTIAFLSVLGYTIGVDTLKDTIEARRNN